MSNYKYHLPMEYCFITLFAIIFMICLNHEKEGFAFIVPSQKQLIIVLFIPVKLVLMVLVWTMLSAKIKVPLKSKLLHKCHREILMVPVKKLCLINNGKWSKDDGHQKVFRDHHLPTNAFIIVLLSNSCG